MSRIFISYKRQDKELVFPIKEMLEKTLGENCWVDLNGIESDAQFATVIITAIKEADIFLFMYSSTHLTINDFQNDWTIKELNFAKLKKKRIVFIKLDSAELSDWFSFEFPHKQLVDIKNKECFNRLINDIKSWLKIENSKDSIGKNLNVDKDQESWPIIYREAMTSDNYFSAKQMFETGEKYYNEKNYSEAVKWYRKAAEQGETNAQNSLGGCYYYGTGVAQDYVEAVKWFRKAAEHNCSGSQCYLGCCYYSGKGVERDYSEAVKWFRKAAGHNNMSAQNNLGECYYAGTGVEQDYSEAAKWFRKAAEQGYMSAQSNLAFCYYNGQGVAQDYAMAAKWFNYAAEQGYEPAQFYLATCYAHGRGVTQNFVEAAKWYKKAAEQGNNYAMQALEILKRK